MNAKSKKPVKRKKLTAARKRLNQEIKKDFQERGILPPDKKKLNRKKFALDVMTEFKTETSNHHIRRMYIEQAIYAMLPLKNEEKIINRVTPEQVGVLKVIKMAIELEKFWERQKANGKETATVEELYMEVMKPICDL